MSRIDHLSQRGTTEAMTPYFLRLWLPLLVYSLIEVSFKNIGHYFVTSGFGLWAIEIFAYLLRAIFEVCLLTQLALLLNGEKINLSHLKLFPFEKIVKNIFARLLVLAALIAPVALISLLLMGNDPSSKSTISNFQSLFSYFLITIWLYAAIYFTFAWWFTTLSIVFEESGPVASLQRSFHLTRHHWFSTVFTVLHAIVRGLIVVTLVTIAFSFIVGGIGMVSGILVYGNEVSKSLLFDATAKQVGPLFYEIVLGFPLQGFVAIAVAAKFFQLREQFKHRRDVDEDEDEDD